jgi:hypothetical protein
MIQFYQSYNTMKTKLTLPEQSHSSRDTVYNFIISRPDKTLVPGLLRIGFDILRMCAINTSYLKYQIHRMIITEILDWSTPVSGMTIVLN